MAEKKNKSHYISGRESRKIARSNAKITKELVKRKKRKNVESEYLTEMKDAKNIVEFDNLHTYFYTDAGVVKAVNGVSFSIPAGSTVGVVGESGCGKSVTSLSLMQLVQGPSGQIVDGSIRFRTNAFRLDEEGKKIPVYETEEVNGEQVVLTDKKGNPIHKKDELGGNVYEMDEKVYDIAKMPLEVMRSIRGREIAMIFQEPMTSLNPVFTIGNQLDEVAFLHIEGISKKDAKKRSVEMLTLVGIADPEGVYNKFPHELSGGMRQRVMIAMALLCNPRLIIADEPTTALDVTIQAQILDLLRDIKDKISGSIMLITHDLGVVAEMADYVVVMYAGKVIEMGTVEDIFDNPLHPYTIGLQKSKPTVDGEVDSLYCIPGFVPNPVDMPNYCYFRDRCDKCTKDCAGEYPQLIKVSDTHSVSCYLYKDGVAPKPAQAEEVADLSSKRDIWASMFQKEPQPVEEPKVEETVVEEEVETDLWTKLFKRVKEIQAEKAAQAEEVEAMEVETILDASEAEAEPAEEYVDEKEQAKAEKKARKKAEKTAKKDANTIKKEAKRDAKAAEKALKDSEKATKAAELEQLRMQQELEERKRLARADRSSMRTFMLVGIDDLTGCDVEITASDPAFAESLKEGFYNAGAKNVKS